MISPWGHHRQTTSSIRPAQRTVKDEAELVNHLSPGKLAVAIGQFVAYYNQERHRRRRGRSQVDTAVVRATPLRGGWRVEMGWLPCDVSLR